MQSMNTHAPPSTVTVPSPTVIPPFPEIGPTEAPPLTDALPHAAMPAARVRIRAILVIIFIGNHLEEFK